MSSTIKTHYPLSEEITQKAKVLSVAGDATRMRILCFMFDNEEACVSEIAEALDMSVAAISHHLLIMRDSNILSAQRMGKKVCYALEDNEGTQLLKNYIC